MKLLTKDSTPEEAQEAWIDSLLHGGFPQGQHRLRQKVLGQDRFCCLGIACEIAVKAGVIPEPVPGDSGVYRYANGPGRQQIAMLLPDTVKDFFRLRTRGGEYENKGMQSLYARNDSGKTFAEIAEIIKSRPQGLFADRKETHGNNDSGTNSSDSQTSPETPTVPSGIVDAGEPED